MKIDKIDIQISNKKHATDVAMLVDKLEFLQEVNKLREKWKIKQLHKLSLPYEILNIDNVISKGVTRSEEAQKNQKRFYRDIENILRTFSRGKNFVPIVAYAVATGTVPEGIYKSCYFDLVTLNEQEDPAKQEKYQYVIVLSPRTEQQELIEAYKEFEEHIKAKIDFSSRLRSSSTNNEDLDKFVQQTNDAFEKDREQYLIKVQKLKTQDEINKAGLEFIERYQDLRDSYISKIPIDMAIPEHMDLIDQYHKGSIYTAADIDKFDRKAKINTIREWYWMRYGDSFNDLVKKPTTYKQVYFDWLDKCPKTNEHENKKDEAECPYCSVQSWNNIEVALKDYKKLLSLS